MFSVQLRFDCDFKNAKYFSKTIIGRIGALFYIFYLLSRKWKQCENCKKNGWIFIGPKIEVKF